MRRRDELVPAHSPLQPKMPSNENLVPGTGSPQQPSALSNKLMPAHSPTGSLLQQPTMPSNALMPATGLAPQPDMRTNALTQAAGLPQQSNAPNNALMPTTGSLQQPTMVGNKDLMPAGSPQQHDMLNNSLMPAHGLMQQPNMLSNKYSDSLQKFMGDRSMLTMSDDAVMLKQIQATHAPGGFDFDVKPILVLVEDILSRATMNFDTGMIKEDPDKIMEGKARKPALTSTLDSLERRAHLELEGTEHQDPYIFVPSNLTIIFERISKEIKTKTMYGADAHSATLSICNMLSTYDWDAKLVLTLAAFALDYGDFWLLARVHTINQLAKSMAILKGLPAIMEHSAALKTRFDAVDNLIRAMLEVTELVVQFKELPSTYISTQDMPTLSAALAHVPTAVYWTIRSAVACATQISRIQTMGSEYVTTTTEAWELSTLAHKLKNIHDHLKKQLDVCVRFIEEKRNVEAYQMLVDLFNTVHIDNMKVLKALLGSKDDMQPLRDGQTKERVSIEVLRRRNVLLLISDLNISPGELSILEQIYNESKNIAYEVVWIPVVDPSVHYTDEMHKKFETLLSTMPWYSVNHPKQIERHVIRFIKEVWHFRSKPILVVLDPQGRIACPNAIHMMWIWGSTAFPFTSAREEALWRQEAWSLELLIDGIDPTILDWIRGDKYIFLYGGDDIEWIRKFTNTAKAVAQATPVPLEMAYVGKSNKREKVRRAIATITSENLSYCWQDLTTIWFFWTRLESMLFSKIQLGKEAEHDMILKEIKKLLSYDKEGGWAILCKGSTVVVNSHSIPVFATLAEYDIWKEHVKNKGFDRSYKEHHDNLLRGITHPCSRFEFHSLTGHGRIPESMKCPECLRVMDKFITFLCCHDEPAAHIMHH